MIIVGSRAYGRGVAGSADQWSDWDFQVVTSQPKKFRTFQWTLEAELSPPLAYVERKGRLGHTQKVSAAFVDGDLDLVLIPTTKILALKWLLAVGMTQRVPQAQRALNDLTGILNAGHKIVKCERKWKRLFRRLTACSSPARSNDDEICAVANGFICDYLSMHHKVQRGEYLAAQRWLHINLGEANFRLLHELQIRAGVETFPDGRRVEGTAPHEWQGAVSINAAPDRESLNAAMEKSANTCRLLVDALLGGKWKWPDLTLRLR